MLFYDTITPGALDLLKKIQSEPFWSALRLVGGTALALQYGHRRSVDLDMFGLLEPDINTVTQAVANLGNVVQGPCSEKVKTYRIDDIKVDFVDYSRYEWIDEPVIENGIRLASPKDIAAMKVNAIEGRGSRKDFVDMYFLLHHYSIDEVLDFYKQKYPEHSEYRALMSLTYFADAEQQPMPQMFIDTTWQEIKRRILKEVEYYTLRQTQEPNERGR